MHKRNFLTSAVLLALLAAAALAADITGTWSGTMSMGDNQFQLSYTFKQDGEKLTGTVLGPQGDAIPLNDGKVQGDKLSFSITVEGPNGTMKFLSEGTIKGDEIVLGTKMDGGGDFPGGQMTLKRTK